MKRELIRRISQAFGVPERLLVPYPSWRGQIKKHRRKKR